MQREKQRLRSLGQLQMQQSLLKKSWQDLEDEKIRLQIEREQYQMNIANDNAIFESNRQQMMVIMEANNKILKANEVNLYSIKEATLNTLTDYRTLEKCLSKVLFTDLDQGKLWGLMIGVQTKIGNLEDYFSKTFKMSVDQYQTAKAKSVSSKDFSKN